MYQELYKKSKLFEYEETGPEVYQAIREGKGVYLTGATSLLQRKNQAVREGRIKFCDVRTLPEKFGVTEGAGLMFQKGSPYPEFFNKV